MPIPAGPDPLGVANPTELAVQRSLTRAFIAADEDQIELVRKAEVPDGSGGYTTVPVAVPSQPMRLIPLQAGGPERHTLDGRVVEPGYHLLADWEADMERGDLFTVGGRRYEVVFIVENRTYEVKGEVVYHGDE